MGEPFQITRSRVSDFPQSQESRSSQTLSNAGTAAQEAFQKMEGSLRNGAELERSARNCGFVPMATPRLHQPAPARPPNSQLPSPVCVAAIAATRQQLMDLR